MFQLLEKKYVDHVILYIDIVFMVLEYISCIQNTISMNTLLVTCHRQ